MNAAGPSLADQQRRFAAAIFGETPPDAAGASPGADTAPLWQPGSQPGIYHEAYRARLVEAMRSNYPVLHRVLGDEDFAALVLDYLGAQPSREPSIRWFGDRLAEHLARDAAALPHPSLLDMVRMEWALGTSFDAPDAAPLEAGDLGAIEPARWPSLRFAAHPSLRLLALEWAVEPTWRALTHDEDAQADAPEPLAHRLLVWRQQLETRWRSLPDDEADALQACLAGETFEKLCESLQGDDAAARAAAWLRRWIDDGLLAGLT